MINKGFTYIYFTEGDWIDVIRPCVETKLAANKIIRVTQDSRYEIIETLTKWDANYYLTGGASDLSEKCPIGVTFLLIGSALAIV
jgi:hypothetical protein